MTCRCTTEEEPEPSEPAPAGRLLVPVRPGPLGDTARLFRTPLGARTAVAFTSPGRLVAALGTAQPWITLAEPVLRSLTGPLGVTSPIVDPPLVAPAARPVSGRWETHPVASGEQLPQPKGTSRPPVPAAPGPHGHRTR
ncbi:SAV_915 family protein [Kitasatospora paranensis]|uniref:SAV_915 family protein n=1 Tax=Kitasatospora paranensis TaxID=258053 RepID=A0ABW2FSL4_9ACTN